MQLYNTISRKKEEFVPKDGNNVQMYVCGITAYDLCHIGHARSAVVFDVLVRYLKFKGYNVTFIRNFTDVDDKIINRANQENRSSKEVAETYIEAFYQDMDKLGILRADVEPKATEHIEEMVQLIEELIKKGNAYVVPSGDVYFRVRSFEPYGKLSGRNIEEMEAGARVAPGEEKQDPLDFALWKSAKPGEPSWPSPWGEGRPGWHIECSAMSERHFTLPLDIHGGGQDLVFPHHENEIAQSEAASGKEFARYWVHNGFVQIDSEKMSKSLGNFKTIRDILEIFLPEVLRFFLLTKQYRSPIDFTTEAMEDAEKNLKRIYTAKQQLESELERTKWSKTDLPEDIPAELAQLEAHWIEAMEDDCNSAAALGHIFGAIRLANRLIENKSWRKSEASQKIYERILDDLQKWGGVLGLFTQESSVFLDALRICKLKRRELDANEVDSLVLQRHEAKKAKDFATADAMRDKLLAMGVEVRDTPNGPVWDVI